MACQTCGTQLIPGTAACQVCGAVAPPPGDRAGAPSMPPPAPLPPAVDTSRPASDLSGLSSEARNWGVAAHLSAFLGAFVALAVLGPLVVWLLRREVDGFSERHAREALNFNLTLLVLLVAGVVLTVITLGLGLIVVLPVGAFFAVAWLVLTIVAAVRASEGREYRYPFTIRFVN
jgi:uncharacterized protein